MPTPLDRRHPHGQWRRTRPERHRQYGSWFRTVARHRSAAEVVLAANVGILSRTARLLPQQGHCPTSAQGLTRLAAAVWPEPVALLRVATVRNGGRPHQPRRHASLTVGAATFVRQCDRLRFQRANFTKSGPCPQNAKFVLDRGPAHWLWRQSVTYNGSALTGAWKLC